MQVPFHRPHITDEEIIAVTDILKKHWITMGEKTIEFENKFSSYLNAKNSVALNSGTAALHLSLKCIDLQENDEVIIPSTTFVSTAEVIRYFNATPIMIDIEKDTHLIDASKIEDKISNKTKAIIPVHYAGQPADMDQIISIAEKHNLYVIEDAAHSLPSIYKNKKIGTIGHITCFSFYATKTLATGEGGMAVTENDEWAEKMRILRLHGISKDAWKRYSSEGSWEYDVVDTGYKYNISDINSALGIVQLKKIDLMNKQRENIAQKYNKAFNNHKSIIPYKIKSDRNTSWHLYPVKLNLESLKIDRNKFIELMKEKNIGTSVHFIPLYNFSYYKNLGYSYKEFPESEWVFKRVISLPIFPGMSDAEVNYVIKNVLEILDKNIR